MPLTDKTIEGFLKLGVAGGSMVIVIVVIILLFSYLKENKKTKGIKETNTIDKLCDKIDALITSNHEVLLSNDKDQKVTIDILNQVLTMGMDTQRRVVRIDDRTFKCLGNPEEREEKNENKGQIYHHDIA